MASAERRVYRRGSTHLVGDLFFRALRFTVRHAHGFYTALGVVIVSGAALAVVATWTFTKLADMVQEGATQRFDEAVLRSMAEHQAPHFERLLLEITLLGSG